MKNLFTMMWTPRMGSSLFLTAKWSHLLMVNYTVDPAILTPFIPEGTELDLWEGKAYVSLVGFLFLDTKVLGYSIPFHQNFEEVNLRFYLRQKQSDVVIRGVAFIKEIVPRRAIAWVARFLYNENYIALPMRHLVEAEEHLVKADYMWKYGGVWQKIGASCHGPIQEIAKGSETEFITEHYVGFSKQADGGTVAYEVRHPKWSVRHVSSYEVAVDFKGLYGSSFAFLEKVSPASVFLAVGSSVEVYRGVRLDKTDA